MNETLNTLKKRRSIRKFKSDMPPKYLIEQVIEGGLYAPNGRGKQSPIIIAVTDKALRDKLSRSNAEVGGYTDFDPFYNAPVVLIVLAPKDVPTYLYDGSLVMGNLMNTAQSVGLGSCWIHRAKEEFETEEYQTLLKDLGIEGDYEGIGHCILGYADGDEPTAPPRKDGRVYWCE